MPEPTTRFAGIKSARTRPAADTDWSNERNLGDLSDESQIEYEVPEDDTTTLQEALYAGEFKNVTIVSYAMGQYAQHRADYKADDRIDLEITLMEEETMLLESILPRCMPETRDGEAGGRNAWKLEPTHFSL
jgi:hypothetical protein